MKNNGFSFSLKAKLKQIFNGYMQVLTDPKQLEIINKGFVYSEVDLSAEVLVMGINPSLRTDFLNEDGNSYSYTRLQNDRYFKKFHHLLNEFETSGITYCDLFYQRHSEQKQIDHFMKNESGQSFLKDQLRITKKIIEEVNPKLILLFNRRAADFFTAEWLGFKLVSIKNMGTYEKEISSLYRLENTQILIYCSAFLGYRTPKKTYMQLDEELPRLLELLK